jgi:hypothetical protein
VAKTVKRAAPKNQVRIRMCLFSPKAASRGVKPVTLRDNVT